MDGDTHPTHPTHLTAESVVHGYLQETVTQFLQDAAAAQASLEARIQAAQERQGRARATLGTHRVMSAMLLEAEREISTRRRQVQRRVDGILLEAERQAQSVGTAPSADGSHDTPVVEEFQWTP